MVPVSAACVMGLSKARKKERESFIRRFNGTFLMYCSATQIARSCAI